MMQWIMNKAWTRFQVEMYNDSRKNADQRHEQGHTVHGQNKEGIEVGRKRLKLKSVLQRYGAAVAWLFKLKESQTTRQGKSRTDAYLANLRTGAGQKALATSTHWLQIEFCYIEAGRQNQKNRGKHQLERFTYNPCKLSQ